jgi:hypothetical protein
MSGSITVLDNTNGGTTSATGTILTGGSVMRAVVFQTDNTSTWELRGLRLMIGSGTGDATYTLNVSLFATAFDAGNAAWRPTGTALASVSLSLHFTFFYSYTYLDTATLGAVATTTMAGGTRYALTLGGPTTGPSLGNRFEAPTASNGYSFVRSAQSSTSGSTWSTSAAMPMLQMDVQATCFLRGTMILTPHGEVPVETLHEGDLVVTWFGGERPVRWVGTQRFEGRLAGRGSQPVRLRAGSLGPGMPGSDLLVSPGHAVMVEGVLAHAGALVNGTTIVQDRMGGVIEYFHLDLGAHDCVMANGAWAESYFEDRNRDSFHNAAEFHARFPGHVAERQATCLPVITEGHPGIAVLRAALPRPVRRAA